LLKNWGRLYLMNGDFERLGRIVKARRDQLGLSQREVADQGGPSDSTQTVIERGDVRPVSQLTLKKLDAALRWEPGSAKAILGGGDATPLERAAALPPGSYVAAPGERQQGGTVSNAEVLEAIRDMAAAVRDLRDEVRAGRQDAGGQAGADPRT
jgi:transcriptional regulator with XRE-family HTH domain